MKDATPALTASANGLRMLISMLTVINIGKSAIPSIDLMHRLVVNVRRARLGNVEAISNGFRSLSEVLLFVSDEVFGACLDSGALDAANRVGEEFTSEVWVRTEALPVTTAFG